MKTLVLFWMLGMFNSNSTEAPAIVEEFSYNQVRDAVVDLIDKDVILKNSDSEDVNLIFKVRENQEIEIIEVESGSAVVSNYVIAQLHRKAIVVNHYTADIPYSLTLKFRKV